LIKRKSTGEGAKKWGETGLLPFKKYQHIPTPVVEEEE